MGDVRGEVPVRVETGALAGDYILLLDFNALCDLEDDFPGLMDADFDPSTIKKPKAVRRIFHAALMAHHPDLTLEDAGKIIHALGGDGVEVIANAMAAAYPEAAEGDDRPPAAPPKDGAGGAP